MRTVFMNVGLADSESLPVRLSEGDRLLALIELLNKADQHGAVIVRIAESVTEKTAVVSWVPSASRFFNADQVESFVWRTAQVLGQEAIACIIEGKGLLVGPMASRWGAFDDSMFIQQFVGR